jgi:hypothetical protein
MIGHLMICNEGPIRMSGRHDQVMAAFKKAIAECPADEVDVAFAGRDKLRYGDSSQRGDETTRLTPIPELTCGLPIGLEQPLCGLDVRGAALEPASHEKINPRSKSQLSRCQHKPRVQALVGWSLDVVAGVHLALLPVRRRERPCAESYTLAFRISSASS